METTICFKNYKGFPKNAFSELNNIKYFNVIIGKNNSGKTSALDVVQYFFDPASIRLSASSPEICAKFVFDREFVEKAFPEDRVPSVVPGAFYGYGRDPQPERLIGESVLFSWTPYTDNHCRFTLQDPIAERDIPYNMTIKIGEYLPQFKFSFRKVSAERDVLPEAESISEEIKPNGEGATNLIRSVLNLEKRDESLIEKELLDGLNEIMGKDACYERITIQERIIEEKNENRKRTEWEVFLRGKDEDRFALSKMGSGLKTIILVLLNLIVLPKMNPEKQYAFGFEELENNLHPSLQRRLFDYIYRYAVQHETYFFITTHSHVAINMFFNKDHCSLYHVIKENGVSSIKKIQNCSDQNEILDDLDVKASDLLQANGIVWVEGPSDRIYIKKWLELYGGTDVEEGKDYQFAYYGGRLLSHYSAEEKEGLINILSVNRHSAIVIDSDKRDADASINDTKQRVSREFENKGMFVWITAGKEIENYLTVDDLKAVLWNESVEQCGQYDLFPDYIEPSFKNFSSRKVDFARKVCEGLTTSEYLDRGEKVKKLYSEIKKWNQ